MVWVKITVSVDFVAFIFYGFLPLFDSVERDRKHGVRKGQDMLQRSSHLQSNHGCYVICAKKQKSLFLQPLDV